MQENSLKNPPLKNVNSEEFALENMNGEREIANPSKSTEFANKMTRLKTKRMRKLESTTSLTNSSKSSEEISVNSSMVEEIIEGSNSIELENDESDSDLFSNFMANVSNLKYPMELTALMMEYGQEEEEDCASSDSEGEIENHKKIEDLSKKKSFFQLNFLVSKPYWFRMIAYFFFVNPILLIPLIIAKICYNSGENLPLEVWYKNPLFMDYLLSYISYFLVIGYSSFIFSHVIIKCIRISIQKKTNFSTLDHFPEYLKRIHTPLTVSFWMISLLISWNVLLLIFCHNIPSETCNTVLGIGTKVIVGLLVSGSFWSLERIFLQMTAVRFHSKPYEERILENRKTCYVISQLKHIPKKVTLPPSTLNSVKRKELRPKELQALELPLYSDPSNSATDTKIEYLSASSSKSLASATGIGREPSKLSKFYNITNFMKHLKKHSEKPQTSLNKILKKTRKSTEIIFAKCSQKNRNYLMLDDFFKYFKTKKFAKEAFAIFDPDKTGKVTKKSMSLAILQSLIEKNYIMKSLLDLEDVLSVINNIYVGVMLFILFFVWLAIFELPVQSLLSITLSLIAATVFAISDAAKSTFSSIIFLFSLHPYDVGDKVIIEGDQLLVYKIHLLVTVFRLPDGQEIYMPNSLLSSKKILNIRRSSDTWESFTFFVDYSTKPELIQVLKDSIVEFVTESPEDFYPSIFFAPIKVTVSSSIEINISVQHKSNWQNGTLRWNRHTKILNYILDCLKNLKIQHYPVSKVQSDNSANPFHAKLKSMAM